MHEVDYEETYALVAWIESICLLICLVAQMKWSIYQLDIRSVLLNDYLEKEVYIEQPLGYVLNGNEGKVMTLKKALYRLK